MVTMSTNTESADPYPVYTGVWTNWSRGQVLGATLTLSRRDGDLLIAFTAFFIAFVASRGWRVVCFALHRAYSTSRPRDAVHHQRQAILCNSTSPESGLYMLLLLFWTNRRGSKDPSRLLPAATAAAFLIGAFTIAGGFSSRLSTAVGNEVLIKSANCGLLVQPSTYISDSNSIFSYVTSSASNINSAANYAQRCYSGLYSRDSSDCSRFVTRQLISTGTGSGTRTKTNATCPFGGNVCRTDSTNLYLDTGYINSHDHLGLNAPPDQRFTWRNVVHCAPLLTTGYTSQKIDVNEGKNYTFYHYGNIGGDTDHVYTAESLKSQYLNVFSNETIVGYLNYHLDAFQSPVKNGVTFLSNSDFQPTNDLFRNDSETFLFFLSGNGVLHTQPSDDEWYRIAAVGSNIPLVDANSSSSTSFYTHSEPASPLACTDQYQFCNTFFPGTKGCGLLASERDAIATAAPYFESSYEDFATFSARTEAAVRFTYFTNVIFERGATILEVVSQLGPFSLLSQRNLFSGYQASIEPNQWQLDATHWRDISMATYQAAFVDTVYNTPSLASADRFVNFTTPELQKLCQNQKILSTAYASFSLFGLLLTLILGLLIILTSYLLEPVSDFLHKKKGYKQYEHLEWVTNGTLQLQRLGHEEKGIGSWSRCTSVIPTTEAGDLLGCLDIQDPTHPVLRPPLEEKDPANPSQDSITPLEAVVHGEASSTEGSPPPTVVNSDSSENGQQAAEIFDADAMATQGTPNPNAPASDSFENGQQTAQLPDNDASPLQAHAISTSSDSVSQHYDASAVGSSPETGSRHSSHE